jgi:hypothetical protein
MSMSERSWSMSIDIEVDIREVVVDVAEVDVDV